MKKMISFVGLSFMLLLGSCTQDNIIETTQSGGTEFTATTRVPLEEALKKADRLFAQIGTTATRSHHNISVEYYTPGQNTRTGNADPLYYIVNYGEDEGFAVLGADSRLDAIYAISDEGHLQMNDTSRNEGLAIFFSTLHRPQPLVNQNWIQCLLHGRILFPSRLIIHINTVLT